MSSWSIILIGLVTVVAFVSTGIPISFLKRRAIRTWMDSIEAAKDADTVVRVRYLFGAKPSSSDWVKLPDREESRFRAALKKREDAHDELTAERLRAEFESADTFTRKIIWYVQVSRKRRGVKQQLELSDRQINEQVAQLVNAHLDKLFEKAPDDPKSFQEIRRFYRNDSNIEMYATMFELEVDSPPDWQRLVAERIEGPSVLDFGVYDPYGRNKRQMALFAARTVREPNIVDAKLIVALYNDSKRYRNAIGASLYAELVKYVECYNAKHGISTKSPPARSDSAMSPA